jgi:Ca2+-binding RTX toxin-like protein
MATLISASSKLKGAAMLESLEIRRMMSTSVWAYHGTLYVHGDNGVDHIGVAKDGGDLVVRQSHGGGYEEIYRVAGTYLHSVMMYGFGGDDLLSIDSQVTQSSTICGGAGADVLFGGGGTTRLWGHGNESGSGPHSASTDDAGADTLISGSGTTYQSGQNGNDKLFTDENAVSGYEVMYGGEGNDYFYINGGGPIAFAYGEGGSDTFVPAKNSTQQASFYGGAGADSVSYRNWDDAVFVRPDGSTWSGLRYGTRLHLLHGDTESFEGTDQGDYFHGSSTDEWFYGWGGHDVMYGRAGADKLIGGDGRDTLYGDAGDDFLVGGEGNDVMHGGDNEDIMHGNQGSDVMHGNGGHDKVYGREDTDWLYGDAGDDTLVGGAGSDYLYANDGVAGNDRVYGDNEDGTGRAGGSDVAVIDWLNLWQRDWASGIESISI